MLGGVERRIGDERALLCDDVVTLRGDAQHHRPAREDDDEIHERDEKEAPAERHDPHCTGTERDVSDRLPAAEIDVPRVQDLVTPRNVPLRLALAASRFRAPGDAGTDECPQVARFARTLSGPPPALPGWVTAPGEP